MSSYRVLLVEDDVELAELFLLILQAEGLEVDIVRDGRQAQQRVAETVPDIVVLDNNLPYVSGLEILAQVRSDHRLAKTKVVVITANPQAAVLAEDSADLTLVKPVSLEQVRELVSRVVYRIEAERQGKVSATTVTESGSQQDARESGDGKTP